MSVSYELLRRITMQSVVIDLVLKAILVVIFVVVVYFIVKGLKKNVSGIKGILLGINITLFGGIIALDPHSNVGGGYIIALIGLMISAKCLAAKD
jgi:hypothetical protein